MPNTIQTEIFEKPSEFELNSNKKSSCR